MLGNTQHVPLSPARPAHSPPPAAGLPQLGMVGPVSMATGLSCKDQSGRWVGSKLAEPGACEGISGKCLQEGAPGHFLPPPQSLLSRHRAPCPGLQAELVSSEEPHAWGPSGPARVYGAVLSPHYRHRLGNHTSGATSTHSSAGQLMWDPEQKGGSPSLNFIT